MPVNYNLCYLLSHQKINESGVLTPEYRSRLSTEECRQLQLFAEKYPERFLGSISRAFCNQGTYELHEKAKEVSYDRCFSKSDVELIQSM